MLRPWYTLVLIPLSAIVQLNLYAGTPCTTIADCADLDSNGVRDDTCIWWACTAGTCVPTEVTYGDMGSIDGGCPPDSEVDFGDRNHALNCFSNRSFDCSLNAYDCADNTPQAYNVDVAGLGMTCIPDGICDASDAFAVLNKFVGASTCSCPLGGPAPTVHDAPAVVGTATVVLRPARRVIAPGDSVAVDVLLGGPAPALSGYQLHIDAAGGTGGHLGLHNIGVRDRELLERTHWRAFNPRIGQMVAGRDRGAIKPAPLQYLATYTFVASEDARGAFVIDLRYGAPLAENRTILFPHPLAGRIDIIDVAPAIIEIDATAEMTTSTQAVARAPIPQGVRRATGNNSRVFMAVDGTEDMVATTGFTALSMNAGESLRVSIWVEDLVGGQLLSSYQLQLPQVAAPHGGAAGTVAYVDVPPTGIEGDSVLLDTERGDWLFALIPFVAVPPIYQESVNERFGALYSVGAETIDLATPGDVPNPGGIHYLGEFFIFASIDSAGVHEIDFFSSTQLFLECGALYEIDAYQPLRINVGPDGPCMDLADCSDLDGDLIRDDNCLIASCDDGFCSGVNTVFGDMAGVFGTCAPDGATDGNDAIAAIRCFENTSVRGTPGYECEDHANYPPNPQNTDAGGPFGDCCPDGVCDIHDYFHALNSFSRVSTCQCRDNGPDFECPSTPLEPVPSSGIRVFMAQDDQQNRACSGATCMAMEPGTATTVMAWLEDSGSEQPLTAYQLIFGPIRKLEGTTGDLVYVDNAPGQGGGDTILVDKDRDDWAFSTVDEGGTSYAEFIEFGYFGTLHRSTQVVVPTNIARIHYLAQFDIRATADANGVFEISFLTDPQGQPPPRPRSALLGPDGARYNVSAYQTIRIVIGPLSNQFLSCTTREECGDLDGDGIKDERCSNYDCQCGLCCAETKDDQADFGGPFGLCAIDSSCDGGDFFHALRCFANEAFIPPPPNAGPYPCENNPPRAINIDAGGPECCTPDGVCDNNDAFHAKRCFADEWFDGSAGYRCACPADSEPLECAVCNESFCCDCTEPAPCSPCGGPSPDSPLPERQQAGLVLRGPRSATPGGVIAIDVHLDDDVAALSGYQLHFDARTSLKREIDLVDITVDTAHPAYVFGHDVGTWKAFNRASAQMLAGIDLPHGLTAARGNYLATVFYRIPADATGRLTVDLLHDVRPAKDTGRTFLYGRFGRLIELTTIIPIEIEVSRPHPVSVRRGR